jgi:hypothetical protein
VAVDRSIGGPASWSTRLRDAVGTPERVALLALAGLLMLSLAVRLWLARLIATPWIMTDELTYSELAKSLATSGHLLIRETPTHLVSFGYPAAIAPAWWLHPMSATYDAAKAINVVMATATAIPVFLWARRLVTPLHSVIAAVLTLLMPAFAYTGMLMTENAFLPAFVLAAYVIAVALERPTVLRQLLAFGAILLASFFRLQGLVLLGVLPLAILLKVLFDLRVAPRERASRFAASELRRYWVSAALLLVGVVLYVLWELAHGRTLSSGLGSYQVVAHGEYSVGAVRHWTLLHFAELPLFVGALPASALLLLVILAVGRGGTRSEAERAFLAVAAAAVPLVVVEAAAYASRFSIRIEERYMFFLAPLLFLSLVLWLDRSLPRPRLATIVAAMTPPLLFLALPLGSLLNVSIYSDTFGLIPFLRLSHFVDGIQWTERLLLAGGIVAALVFALWPRTWLPSLVLPGAIAVFLVLSSYAVTGALRDYSRNVRNQAGTHGSPSWIDRAVGPGRETAFLLGTTVDPWPETQSLWQQEFWNRRLAATYNLGVPDPAGGVEVPVAVSPQTGSLVATTTSEPVRERYVVTSLAFGLGGRVVAVRPPFALYRTDGRVRVGEIRSGIYGDGWMGADAAYTRFASRPAGQLTVSLSRKAWSGPDVPGHVRVELLLRRGPRAGKAVATQRWTIHRGQSRSLTLRTPRAPFTVAVHVEPTFTPSQFGRSDPRQLGAQIVFTPR